MRKKIVAGNWKMNKDLAEGLKLASEIVNMVKDEVTKDVTVIITPPFIHLTSVSRLLAENNQVLVAAQNCSEKESGAFTGEVSAAMLRSIPVQAVILGHSERRQYFGEGDELLAKKVDMALGSDLMPIFCCGEPLEIREKETHAAYVSRQLKASLFHLSEDEFAKVVIAYEPIWAIGTGKTASPEQAQQMHLHIRNVIADQYGKEVASNTTILYGGSCNPHNAQELFALDDVDGGLIGGASLKSRDFLDIIKSF